MTTSFELEMQPRTQFGTAASRRLRRDKNKESVPTILYGNNEPTIPLSVAHSALDKVLKHDSFYSSILTIKVGANHYRAVVKALQRDPVKPKILHLDFLRIDEKKPITITVPIHFTGENIAPGIKQGGGTVNYQTNTIELSCLPKNLPEAVTVDISELKVSEHISLSDITLPEGVTLATDNKVLVQIVAPKGQSSTDSTATEVNG